MSLYSAKSDLDYWHFLDDDEHVRIVCKDCGADEWVRDDDPTEVCTRCLQKREQFVYSHCNVRRA